MPLEFRVDEAVHLRVSRVCGVHTNAELEAFGRAMRSDPRYDPTHRALIDLRPVVSFEVSALGLRAFAAGYEGAARQQKRAFVVSSRIAHGMTRMLQALADLDSETFGIFEDIEEAKTWLGLPAGYRTPFEREAAEDRDSA